MVNSKLLCLLLPLATLGLAAAEPPAKVTSAELDAVAGTALTPKQKTVLAAVDARIVGVEAIIAKVDDPEYKEDILSQLAELKKSRLELEKNFDQGLYEVLMHSVISRYQVIALWLKAPALPPPPGTAVVITKRPKRKGTDKGPGGLGAY
jgi:hypothetical protein